MPLVRADTFSVSSQTFAVLLFRFDRDDAGGTLEAMRQTRSVQEGEEMRKRRYLAAGLIAAMAATILGAQAASAAQTQTVRGAVRPAKLPKRKRVPISLRTVTTTSDPSAANQVPSPATRAVLHYDDAGQIYPGVAARCAVSAVANKSTADAKAACPKAIVGGGSAEVFVPTGPTSHVVFNAVVTAFNGQPQGGHPTIILHNYVADLALGQDLTGVFTRSRLPDYGPKLTVTIPPLPLGAALTRFDTTVGNGFKRGWVKSNCSDRNHRLNVKGIFTYENGQSLSASSKQRCRVRRRRS
jgi:hypothetical protein